MGRDRGLSPAPDDINAVRRDPAHAAHQAARRLDRHPVNQVMVAQLSGNPENICLRNCAVEVFGPKGHKSSATLLIVLLKQQASNFNVLHAMYLDCAMVAPGAVADSYAVSKSSSWRMNPQARAAIAARKPHFCVA